MTPPGNEMTNGLLVKEFNAVITEVEAMLNAMPEAGGEKPAALRARLASIAINLLGKPGA